MALSQTLDYHRSARGGKRLDASMLSNGSIVTQPGSSSVFIRAVLDDDVDLFLWSIDTV